MDRICARTHETYLLIQLVQDWLQRLQPGVPPISQKRKVVRNTAAAATDAMRGPLLHSARVEGDKFVYYNIITPTVWNFAPKDKNGSRGPVESALVGTAIPSPSVINTVLGRIIRSFDPCLACGTHVINLNTKKDTQLVI